MADVISTAATQIGLPDLKGRPDVETLVREFYRRAFDDDLLGHIFVDVARMDLEAHLPTVCDFWETVLFRAGSYHRNVFVVHARLNAMVALRPEYFTRWLALWDTTIDARYAGGKAERAKTQAARMAASMSRRLGEAPPRRDGRSSPVRGPVRG